MQAIYPNGICHSGCTCADDYPLLTGGKLFPNSPRHQWFREYLGDANEKTDLEAVLKAIHQQSYWSVLGDLQKKRFEGVSTRLRHHPHVVVTNRGFDFDADFPPCVDHLADGDVRLDLLWCEQVQNKRRSFFYSPLDYMKKTRTVYLLTGNRTSTSSVWTAVIC
jgi:hypothetical protein